MPRTTTGKILHRKLKEKPTNRSSVKTTLNPNNHNSTHLTPNKPVLNNPQPYQSVSTFLNKHIWILIDGLDPSLPVSVSQPVSLSIWSQIEGLGYLCAHTQKIVL